MRPTRTSAELKRIASRIDASAQPSRPATAFALRRILASVSDFVNPKTGEASSQLLWSAMSALGVEDWGPGVSLSTVLAKMQELAGPVGCPTDYALKYAKENYQDYISHYA